jgi:hypothetical protein
MSRKSLQSKRSIYTHYADMHITTDNHILLVSCPIFSRVSCSSVGLYGVRLNTVCCYRLFYKLQSNGFIHGLPKVKRFFDQNFSYVWYICIYLYTKLCQVYHLAPSSPIWDSSRPGWEKPALFSIRWVAPSGIVVSVPAIEPKVHVLKVGRERWTFKGVKISAALPSEGK